MISCLDVRYPELAEALAAIPDSDRAKKVSQVVRVATSRCEIDVSGLSIDQLDRLVEQMDEHAWAAMDTDDAAFDRLFRKARAVAAARFSHDGDEIALAESIYEAAYAIDPDAVRWLLRGDA